MLCRYIGTCGKEIPVQDDVLAAFSDKNAVDPILLDAMSAMCSAGIVRGYQDNTLRPVNGASRAQVATMLLRMEDILPTLPDKGVDQ